MKLNVVVFLYLFPNNWEPVSENIFESLVNSGLYEESEKILVSLVSDKNELSKFEKVFLSKYKKLKIFEVSEENTFEFLGMKSVYECSKSEDKLILYLHSKGVTSGNISVKNHRIRKYFLKKLVEEYKKVLEIFKKNNQIDVYTLFPSDEGFAWYNFFWVQSSYIKKYCVVPTPTTNRYFWEKWIGNPNSKKENIITYSPIIEYEKLPYGEKLINLMNQGIKEV